MMDPQVFQSILSSAGGGGIVAAFAYMLFKAYITAQEKRIEALEERSKDCESDRIEMRKEMIALQRQEIEDTREALTRSTVVMEKLTELAEKKGFSIISWENGGKNDA